MLRYQLTFKGDMVHVEYFGDGVEISMWKTLAEFNDWLQARRFSISGNLVDAR
jgi:hypothetical protein